MSMRQSHAALKLRVFETPLLLLPRKAAVIASVLAEHIEGVAPFADVDVASARAEAVAARDRHSAAMNRFDAEPRGPKVTNAFGESYTQTRYLFKDGVALVTVEGSLVNRGAFIGASSGVTSYEGVETQLASAAADRDVAAIVLDLDSPGGEAVGAFEMAAFVRAIAAEKPVYALVNGMAASAAYAMASGATRIMTTKSGLSGSIGVVMLHLDQSKRMEKAGVVPTLIFAGGHKVDGNPYEPLPEDVRADFQAEIDKLYGMFVATVAQGRAGLSEEAIRNTQARTFTGRDAIAAGLADEIGTLADLFSSSRRTSGLRSTQGVKMSATSNGGPGANTGSLISREEVARMIAEDRRAQTAAIGEKIGALLGGADPRVAAFTKALSKGVDLDVAADLAAMVPAHRSGKTRLLEQLGAPCPNLGADLGADRIGPVAGGSAGTPWSQIIAKVCREAGVQMRTPPARAPQEAQQFADDR